MISTIFWINGVFGKQRKTNGHKRKGKKKRIYAFHMSCMPLNHLVNGLTFTINVYKNSLLSLCYYLYTYEVVHSNVMADSDKYGLSG